MLIPSFNDIAEKTTTYDPNYKDDTGIIDNHRNLEVKISNFVFGIVPADCLASSGIGSTSGKHSADRIRSNVSLRVRGF